jgi:hypothetical protein
MDETPPPSEQRPALSPLLQPVDTLKQHWLEEIIEEEVFPWEEYRLHGKPPSLKAFVDLFLLSAGRSDMDRFVWVDNWRTLVSVGDEHDYLPDPGLDYKARLMLWLVNPRTDLIMITIFSTSREAAMSCLDFLVELPDSYFKLLIFSGALDHEPGDNEICPFTNRRLKHILRQDAKRKICFAWNGFTAAQGRVLASSGSRTTLYSILVSLCGSMLFWTVSQSDKMKIRAPLS